MKKINFEYVSVLGSLEVNKPKPAVKKLPDSYKKMRPYMGGDESIESSGELNHTVKRCIPFLDAMTAGYILETPADLYVTMQGDKPFIQWRTQEKVLEAHSEGQIPDDLKPSYCYDIPFKLINNYVIRTPKGYSCMFLPVLNVPNNPIVAAAGIVDTDTFEAVVHFPFFLQKGFTGKIPAGTPVVQIIPFKRDNWVSRFAEANYKNVTQTVATIKRQMEFAYKKLFWQRKEYR